MVSIASGAPTAEEVSETSVADVQKILDSAKPEDNDLASPITEAPVIPSDDTNVENVDVKKESVSAAPEIVTEAEDVVLAPEKEENSASDVGSLDEVLEPVKENTTSDSEVNTAVVSNVEVSVTPEKENPTESVDDTNTDVDPMVDYIDYDYPSEVIIPEAVYRPEQFPEGGFIPPLSEPDYENSDMDYPLHVDIRVHSPQNDFHPDETAEPFVEYDDSQNTPDVIPPEFYVEDPSVIPPPKEFGFGPIVAGAEENPQNGPVYGIFANFPTPAPPVAEFPGDESMQPDLQTVELPIPYSGDEPIANEHVEDIIEDPMLEDPSSNIDDAFMNEEDLVNSELDPVTNENIDPASNVYFMPPAGIEFSSNLDSEPSMEDGRPQSMDEKMPGTTIEVPIKPTGVVRLFSALMGIPNRIRGDMSENRPVEPPTSVSFPFRDYMNEPSVVEDPFPINANVFSNDYGPSGPSFFDQPKSDVTINLDFDNQMAYVNGEPHSIRRPASLIVLIDDIIQAAERSQTPNNFGNTGLYDDYSSTFDGPAEPSFYGGFHFDADIPPFFDTPPFFGRPQRMRYNPLKSFVHGLRGRFGTKKMNRMRSMDAYRFGGPDLPPFNPYY